MTDEQIEVEEDWRARKIRESSCGGNGGAGCHSQWCADCKRDEEARDYLDEAERIAAGTSRLIAERAHVEALAAALREARKDSARLDALQDLVNSTGYGANVYGGHENERMAYSIWTGSDKHCIGTSLRDSLDNLIPVATPSGETREGTSTAAPE